MTTETRSLHRKLAQIMHEAERIPKNGRAPGAMGGYPFVQVGDAADFVRKALAEQVLTMMPTDLRVIQQVDRTTKAGGSMTTVDIVMDWTITDGESGESIVIRSFGAGADGGDKYSGKAQTNAMKYALLMGFLLSTGEDPELGHETEPARPAAPRPVTVRGMDNRPQTAAEEVSDILATHPPAGLSAPDDDIGTAFDALVTQKKRHAPAPQRASQDASQDASRVPTCPVHKWDDEPRPMKPDTRASHPNEWHCTAKVGDGYCQERWPR